MSQKNTKDSKIQNSSNKDHDKNSVHSASWLKLSGSNYVPTSPKNFHMEMNSSTQQDNRSSSTESTDQSQEEEISGSTEGSLPHQCICGNDTTSEKHTTSVGVSVAFAAPKLDSNQSLTCIPYAYADPFYGGVQSAYGPHAVVHPQMVGVPPTSRVPSPPEPVEEEPIYVNAKQYHAILRRRQLRAKQEAQNKLIKERKESSKTGQSQDEVSGSSEDNRPEQCICGNGSTSEKHNEGDFKPTSSVGVPEVAFLLPKLDYNQTIVHPQMLGIAPTSRVLLPPDSPGEEPIYVNAKQYYAILRRRELRAKQDAHYKCMKERKTYLHESQHLHATKWMSEEGGRFLDTKKLQQRGQSSGNGRSNKDSGGFRRHEKFGFSPTANDFRF